MHQIEGILAKNENSINQDEWCGNNSVNDELKVTLARSESWIGSLADSDTF